MSYNYNSKNMSRPISFDCNLIIGPISYDFNSKVRPISYDCNSQIRPRPMYY